MGASRRILVAWFSTYPRSDAEIATAVLLQSVALILDEFSADVDATARRGGWHAYEVSCINGPLFT